MATPRARTGAQRLLLGRLRPRRADLLAWLLLGAGPGPGQDKAWSAKRKAEMQGQAKAEGASKRAVKCDMCKDIEGGAACVRACPTGAAIRVSPEAFFSFANLGR